MTFFNLPDLGEGIPEADIVEWRVNEGDAVKEDQIVATVETAKAVVEVPSPITGVIARLCGKPGDTILTGEPLVEFVAKPNDTATVVGKLHNDAGQTPSDDTFFIGTAPASATPPATTSNANIKALADALAIDVQPRTGQRPQNCPPTVKHYPLQQPQPLKGVRRHTARTMATAHTEVVAVTLFDEADIHHWPAKADITVRLIQAIVVACQQEPALNAWFDGASMSCELRTQVDLGLAVDSADGLLVPVIADAGQLTTQQLRTTINTLRNRVSNRSLSPDALQGASITLSNFGVFAGKYATPIVVPPTVCIVGAGALRESIVSVAGQPASHRLLPLSLSFDHRAVTGGEASRFLKVLLTTLQDEHRTIVKTSSN